MQHLSGLETDRLREAAACPARIAVQSQYAPAVISIEGSAEPTHIVRIASGKVLVRCQALQADHRHLVVALDGLACVSSVVAHDHQRLLIKLELVLGREAKEDSLAF